MSTDKTETVTMYAIQCRDKDPGVAHTMHWWDFQRFLGEQNARDRLVMLRKQFDFREWRLMTREVTTTVRTTPWKEIEV